LAKGAFSPVVILEIEDDGIDNSERVRRYLHRWELAVALHPGAQD